MIKNTTLSLVLVTGLFQTAFGAEITGKVTLKGTPPKETPIYGHMDANCKKAQTNPKVATRHYVVGEGSGLANVFVWIKEGVSGKFDAPAKEAVLNQTGCEYTPYVQGIMAGQKLKILNSDPFLHNVNCQPKGNKGFNIAQVVKGQSTIKTFDKPEVMIRFKCDVHPWMFAYVGVVEHPFFAVTDKNGNFKIPNLPAGKYKIEAYHLKSGKMEQEITVAASDKKEVSFTMEPKARKR